jgi:hypothetical protein
MGKRRGQGEGGINHQNQPGPCRSVTIDEGSVRVTA